LFFQDLAYDVRFAVRSMRKSILATATIVLCLGFSTGATSTIFAWMETIVFQPLPGVHDLARLASLKTTTINDGEHSLSYPEYTDVRGGEGQEGTKAFLDLAAFDTRQLNLRTTVAAEQQLAEPLWGALTSANYFDVLGVQPIAGRNFRAGEDAVPVGAPVVVISHALWQRRFAGDHDVIGRRVWLNSREMTIVGIAPPAFRGTIARLALDLWIPLTMHEEVGGYRGIYYERDARWLQVFGRLAPNVSLASARAAAQTTGTRLAASYLEDKDRGLTARTFDIGPVDRIAPLFTVMLGITVLVLLIVCSNVANLLLQRGAAREHEMAVRIALGARPARVVRQLMTESLLLVIGGGVLGAAMLAWARNALNALVPATPLTIVTDTPIDGRVVLVLTGVGVSALFLFGLAPALRAARVAVRASLSGGANRGGTRSGGFWRGALVSAQFALSLAVLVTAGLFLRRLDDLQRVDRGFRDPEHVVLCTVNFIMSGVHDDPTKRALTERLVEQVATLPGVRASAAATFVPLGFVGYASMDTAVDGYVPRTGESTRVLVNRITGGYFETMGIPIMGGRPIEAADRNGARAVAVVNEAFARRFWGTRDPIGRVIRVGGADEAVVGVAADGKYEFLAPLDAPSPPFVYLPFAQWQHWEIVLHVRAEGDPLALVPSIQRMVTSVDGRLSVMSPSTLDSYSSVPYLPIRMGSRVLSVLGGAALVLATVGLYAVTAYSVGQRQREIGIRMALGATPGRMVAQILAHAARYAGAGTLAGLALAAVVAEGLARKVPGSIPRMAADWLWPFALATVALGAVAAIAAIIPANRATRVNPIDVLREE
jgi:predicted permease